MNAGPNITWLLQEPVSDGDEHRFKEKEAVQSSPSKLDAIRNSPLSKPDLAKPESKKSIRALLGWLLTFLVIAAVLGYLTVPYALGPIVAVDVIRRQDMVQTIVASGLIQTPFRINVGSQVTGKVADVPVAEGETVAVNTLLVQLDNLEATEAVRLAQSVVMQSQTKLKQLNSVAGPSAVEFQKQAQTNLTTAERALERATVLQRRNYVSKAALDEARRARDIAQSQLRAADLQVTSNSPGGTDYLVAQAQLAQAEASLNSAKVKMQYYQIRAPRSGTIIKRSVERGNVVQPGTALMILAPEGETQIVVEIDEVNLSLLQTGQNATISADAFPKQRFAARVSYINPSIDPQRGSVEVKLTVANPPEYLRQDMTVSVEVEVARRAQVVVVDASSIHEFAGTKPWINIVKNGRVQRQDITLGTIGDSAAEVIAGLKPGDVVVRSSISSLTVGQRVRTSKDE
jgi:HlyD family secretion protein